MMAGAVGLGPTHNGFRDRRATNTLNPMAPAFRFERKSGGLEPLMLPLHQAGI